MPVRSRRAVLALLASGTVGCLDRTSDADSPEDVLQRALRAHEAFLEERLRNAPCLTSWTTTSTTGIAADATVYNTTADGSYVEVTHPYSYEKAATVADDLVAEGVYRVGQDDTERIRGDPVEPC